MEHLPLFYFLLAAHLAFDAVHEELQCLRHQHHAGDMLGCKQLEQGFWYQRTRIHDACSTAKQGDLDSHFKHMTQREDRECPVTCLDVDDLDPCIRIAANILMT